MRYVWCDAGDDPTWEAGDRAGIDGYFFPMFDSVTTQQLLNEAKTRGHAVGIYLGHGWPQYVGKTPAQIAAVVSAEYQRLLVPGLKVMFNLEEHDPEFVASVLEEWRKLRPNVGTSWSMEGMQGGWMAPSFVARILASRTRVVPQCFIGNMARRESDMVLRDLTKRGFPDTSVSMFYDAANLGVGWDGFAFTMGRLP
jgi:hypothetical protein